MVNTILYSKLDIILTIAVSITYSIQKYSVSRWGVFNPWFTSIHATVKIRADRIYIYTLVNLFTYGI